MVMLRNFQTMVNAYMAGTSESSFWFPPQASTVAAESDWLYNFILWISIVSFVLLMIGMIWFMIKYRSRKGHGPEASPEHNQALEITWTVIPTIILVFIFYFGVTSYINMRTPPADAYDILVTAQKWNWQFTYPDGHVDGNLHVPMGKNVRLVMESVDVLHSFFVPAFRTKMDVVPGRYTYLWFQANQTGTFPIFCAEYCGTKHSGMLSQVVVHEEKEFATWLADQGDLLKRMSPAEAGAELYKSRGCVQCHSVDGAPGIAPTFKGLFGKQRSFTDGSSAVADENYIRQSLLEPQAKVVAGFAPVMPTFQGKLKDPEIMAIAAYLKTLSDQGGK